MNCKRATAGAVWSRVVFIATLCLFVSVALPARFAAAQQSLVITVSINAPFPSSLIASPTPGQPYAVDTINITGTATATNGVVANVQVNIDGGGWQNASNTGSNYSTWSFSAGPLANGLHSVNCRAIDQFSGTEVPGAAVNFLIDITPPGAVVVVNDGTGADIDAAAFATSPVDLSANWSSSADPESGIVRYWYSIGTTAGASDVIAWSDNSTATGTTETGLNLIHAQAYYFNVKVENGVGLMSSVTSSDGQVVTIGDAMLSLTKSILSVTAPAGYTGGASDAIPGSKIQYELQFSNLGPGNIVNTLIQDTFPADTTYVPGSMQRCFTGGGACVTVPDNDANNGGDCYVVAGGITCDIGALTSGDGGRLIYKVSIN